MTAFSDLTAGLVAALAGLAGGRVYRGFAWPLPESAASMIFVRPENASSERNSLGPLDWRTGYAIEIRARYTPDTQAPDEAIDGLIGSVFAALAAYGATGVQDVIPGTELRWDYSDADANIVGATLFCDVVHRTESSTLAAWS